MIYEKHWESLLQGVQKKWHFYEISKISWNIQPIVSPLQHDKIQPIWSKSTKFHDIPTKSLDLAANLRKCIEFFFNRAFLLIMTSHYWRGTSIREKMCFSCSFSSNLSVLKVSKRFEYFDKFASAGAPVGLATPPGGGAPAAPGRTNFSKFSNRGETFRTDKFDENEQENHIFSRINEPIQ